MLARLTFLTLSNSKSTRHALTLLLKSAAKAGLPALHAAKPTRDTSGLAGSEAGRNLHAPGLVVLLHSFARYFCGAQGDRRASSGKVRKAPSGCHMRNMSHFSACMPETQQLPGCMRDGRCCHCQQQPAAILANGASPVDTYATADATGTAAATAVAACSMASTTYRPGPGPEPSIISQLPSHHITPISVLAASSVPKPPPMLCPANSTLVTRPLVASTMSFFSTACKPAVSSPQSCSDAL